MEFIKRVLILSILGALVGCMPSVRVWDPNVDPLDSAGGFLLLLGSDSGLEDLRISHFKLIEKSINKFMLDNNMSAKEFLIMLNSNKSIKCDEEVKVCNFFIVSEFSDWDWGNSRKRSRMNLNVYSIILDNDKGLVVQGYGVEFE